VEPERGEDQIVLYVQRLDLRKKEETVLKGKQGREVAQKQGKKAGVTS